MLAIQVQPLGKLLILRPATTFVLQQPSFSNNLRSATTFVQQQLSFRNNFRSATTFVLQQPVTIPAPARTVGHGFSRDIHLAKGRGFSR
jgi:hypothetical protein